jgi:hypothetical protein
MPLENLAKPLPLQPLPTAMTLENLAMSPPVQPLRTATQMEIASNEVPCGVKKHAPAKRSVGNIPGGQKDSVPSATDLRQKKRKTAPKNNNNSNNNMLLNSQPFLNQFLPMGHVNPYIPLGQNNPLGIIQKQQQEQLQMMTMGMGLGQQLMCPPYAGMAQQGQTLVMPWIGIQQTNRPKAQQQICCDEFHKWASRPARNGRPPHCKDCPNRINSK